MRDMFVLLSHSTRIDFYSLSWGKASGIIATAGQFCLNNRDREDFNALSLSHHRAYGTVNRLL